MDLLYLLIQILKITGVALLFLIFIVLVVIVVLLIVPISYDVYIHKTDKMQLRTKAKWLFSIVSFEYIYDDHHPPYKRVLLFGIQMIGPDKNKKKKVRKNINITNREKHKQINNSNVNNTKDEEYKSNDTDVTQSENQEDVTLKPKIQSFKETLKRIISFQYKRELLVDTIEWVVALCRRMKPSTLYVQLEFGMDNPATTGKLLGLLWALYPRHDAYVNVKGNFEEECLNTTIQAKGNFFVGTFLYEFIRYIRLTSVKQLIQYTRKDKRNGN